MGFFISTFSSIVSASLVGGLFFMFENINRQKLFVATLKSLKKECEFNRVHRGSDSSPFQTTFLEKALLLIELHDQCPEIADKASSLFELCKDANLGQLQRRKLIPRDIQDQMKEVAQLISASIKALEQRCSLWRHISWWFGLERR